MSLDGTLVNNLEGAMGGPWCTVSGGLSPHAGVSYQLLSWCCRSCPGNVINLSSHPGTSQWQPTLQTFNFQVRHHKYYYFLVIIQNMASKQAKSFNKCQNIHEGMHIYLPFVSVCCCSLPFVAVCYRLPFSVAEIILLKGYDTLALSAHCL